MKLVLLLAFAFPRAVHGWGKLDTPALMRGSEIAKGETDYDRADADDGKKAPQSDDSRLFRRPGESQRVFVDFDSYNSSSNNCYANA